MSTPRTSLTLLERLRDPSNHAAWQQFDEIYGPLLAAYGVKLGLKPQDAQEAAQRTTVAALEAFRHDRYDRARGRFSHWLLGIARHKIADLCAELARQPIPASQRSSVEAALSLLKDPESSSSIGECQWAGHVLSVCLRRAWQALPDRDMRIFESLTADGQSPAEVAGEMGMTRNAVYKAKYRVLKFMANVRAEVE